VTVTVPPVRSNPRGVLVPLGFWLLLAGGRALCKGVQRCARLLPYAVPMPPEDAAALTTWQVR